MSILLQRVTDLLANCLLLRKITLIMLANANHQLYHFFHNQLVLKVKISNMKDIISPFSAISTNY